MIDLRRHNAIVLLAALLVGALPLLHTVQHVADFSALHAAESAQATEDTRHNDLSSSDLEPAEPAAQQASEARSGPSTRAFMHAVAPEQADCDLCAHTLYGTPAFTQPPVVSHAILAENTRLRSRVVQATPYHFVIRGPPSRA